MGALTQKLKSTQGASMLMALLLMMVAIVTSAVIIAAAVSAMQSLNDSRDEQQVYLEVSSAAELVRDQLESGKCDYKSELTNIYTKSRRSGSYSLSQTTGPTETMGDGLFSNTIKEALAYEKELPGSTFHVTSYSISAGDYDKVNVEVFLNQASVETGSSADATQYNLTVVFSGGGDAHKCKIYLTAEGVTTSTSTSTETTEWGLFSTTYKKTEIVTTSIKWQNAKLQRKEVS